MKIIFAAGIAVRNASNSGNRHARQIESRDAWQLIHLMETINDEYGDGVMKFDAGKHWAYGCNCWIKVG